jgi:NADH-quinone oxidoreductase subunit G
MLALALRQAQQRGADIVVFDPRPISLPFKFKHLATTPERLNLLAKALVKKAVASDAVKALGETAVEYYASMEDRADDFDKSLAALADKLRDSQRPIIVVGLDVAQQNTPSLFADLALILQTTEKRVGLFYLLPGANAFGAGIISNERASFESIIEGVENGSIKALILVESNPFRHFADRQRLENAIDQLELLVVMDYLDSAAVQKADIFIPTATLYETGGLFLNQEGRIQAAPKVHAGGLPIAQTGTGEHPPRIYGARMPGADARAAWEVLAKLTETELPLEEKPLRANILNWLSEKIPEFVKMPLLEEFPEDGLRVGLKQDLKLRFSAKGHEKTKERSDRYQLLLTELTFGTEELSAYSECLIDLEGTPGIMMCQSDAQKMNLTDGDAVSIELDKGTIEANLHVVGNMATGILVIPRHKDLDWQKMDTRKKWIRRDQIRKRKD